MSIFFFFSFFVFFLFFFFFSFFTTDVTHFSSSLFLVSIVLFFFLPLLIISCNRVVSSLVSSPDPLFPFLYPSIYIYRFLVFSESPFYFTSLKLSPFFSFTFFFVHVSSDCVYIHIICNATH